MQLTGTSVPCASPTQVLESSVHKQTDREGQHRKQIMGLEPIGELDASGGDGPRTPSPLRPKAAPDVEARRPSVARTIDGVPRVCSRDCDSGSPVSVPCGSMYTYLEDM